MSMKQVALALALLLVAHLPQGLAVADEAKSGKYALLVGCTDYPNLDEKFNLIGPANDVVLARKMLTERFGFADENIVTLADSVGKPEQLPLRANIEREWQALAGKANKGDQVFVLMAGHGTQSPIAENSQDDTEADGLDEVFLPKDVGPWSDTVGSVTNAIKDDDIRDWIAGIQAKGANLWVIIDACHSGTMTRDAGDEVKREVRPEDLGVPEAVLAKAAERASGDDERESQLFAKPEQTRGVGPEGPTDEPILVALYAAQSIEPTVEKKLPSRGSDRQYYGLLTYTMNEVLSQAESKLTYRELVQQIHRKYVQWGRVSPTPVLEGNGVDREVMGVETFPDRPNITVMGSKFTGFKIDAGAINGLTAGSILAVYPPAGDADDDKPIGHVKIPGDGSKAIESTVEPCEHEGLPAPDLKGGMRCKAVYVDLGDQRLRIAADPLTDDGKPIAADDLELLRGDLEGFAEEHKHVIQVVDPAEAAWLLRYDSVDDKKLYLTPTSGWQGEKEGKLPPLFGPAPGDPDEFVGWLNESLSRISRVQSLLNISGGGGSQWGDTSVLDVQLLGFKNATDRQGEPVEYGSDGINFNSGDRIGFKVKNTGQEPQDVTLLLIDSGYGIHVLYPTPGATNRLFPGNEVLKRGTVTADTTGLEHLVVIAMTGKPVDGPVNFSFLSQPTIERSRAVAGENMNSPLGKIFQSALYGEGNTRGFASDEIENYQIRTLSWKTHPN